MNKRKSSASHRNTSTPHARCDIQSSIARRLVVCARCAIQLALVQEHVWWWTNVSRLKSGISIDLGLLHEAALSAPLHTAYASLGCDLDGKLERDGGAEWLAAEA